MRRFGVVLALLAGCNGCATTTPMAYKGVRIRPAVLQQLADVQDEFARETAWCLTGSTTDGVVTIEDVAVAEVTERTPTSATFDCSAWNNVIGYAHNHPRVPPALCRPSSTDIQSLDAMRFDLLLVSCEDGVFVYRFRGEADLYRIVPSSYRRPVPPSPEVP